ncbi:hypothetical protein CC2G_005450 [Coprinopsis cinerea AmutBmut pab1-1]|nr:hypothetical protein CC2G_005450 [Coprinopsis cinerea AmutBmut pab1-1]
MPPFSNVVISQFKSTPPVPLVPALSPDDCTDSSSLSCLLRILTYNKDALELPSGVAQNPITKRVHEDLDGAQNQENPDRLFRHL